MSTPPQVFCTIRDIEELGIGPNALKTLTAKHKRSAIRAKSSQVATALRKRHLMPLTPFVVEFDASGLTAGSASWSGVPQAVADVVLEVGLGGVAGPGVVMRVSLDDGASWLPSVTLGASGELLVAGVTVTFAGTLVTAEQVTYRAEVEGCIREATALLSARSLLHSRGIDPKTMESLKTLRDEAVSEMDAWAECERRELPSDMDASPNLDEGGPQGDGQQDPWDWQDEP